MITAARGSESCIVSYRDDKGNTVEIDVGGEWLEVDFITGLEKATG